MSKTFLRCFLRRLTNRLLRCLHSRRHGGRHPVRRSGIKKNAAPGSPALPQPAPRSGKLLRQLPVFLVSLFCDIVFVDVFFDLFRESGRNLITAAPKYNQDHVQVRPLQIFPYDGQRNFQRLILRKSIDPCCNQRKGNALAAKLIRKLKRFPIAGTQDIILPVPPVNPLRSYGMNDIFCRKPKSGSDRCLARRDPADFPSFRKKIFRPCCFIDCRIRPTGVPRFRIRSVYNGIRLDPRYVISDNLKRHPFPPPNHVSEH